MLSDLMINRRSIRKYEEKEVEQEKIDLILKSALTSPSSMGRTPWEFIAVTDKEEIKKLSVAKKHGAGFLEGAPAAIVVGANPKDNDVWVEDASIAAIYIQLVAQELGLGSCWVQLRERALADGSSSEEYVKNLCNMPEDSRVLCIIGLGYPAEEKAPHTDEELKKEKIHYNKY